jgi:D-alanyl-D-alanine carboxypeptidase
MLVIPLVAAALAGCSSGKTSTPKNPDAALSTQLHKLTSMPDGPPGAIALVQVGSQTSVMTAGAGDVTTKQPITADDTIRIASVSKAFNGATVLALVSKGSLTLDTTIGQVLPTLPTAWSAVTVAQLLQHESGVPDYIKNPTFVKEFQADPQQVLTPMQLLGFVTNEPLSFKPGSKYGYSDSDNIILGLMVEAVTNGTYDGALAQYVTQPLGLSMTTLPSSSTLPSPYVHGYSVSSSAAPEDDSMVLNPSLAWASGGMVSTPAELNTFVRAYAAGKLFNAATRTGQFRFVSGDSGPPGPGKNAAGLGIYRYTTKCGTVYGHTGNLPGYTTFAASNSNGTRSVVVAVNTQLQDQKGSKPFKALRHADMLGVCAALKT